MTIPLQNASVLVDSKAIVHATWCEEPKMEWFIHLVLAQQPVRHMPPRCDAGERITTRAISWQELVQSAALLRHFPWLRDIASVKELASRHRGDL